MANEAISNIALLYSMAALSGEGGSGGGSGGTVSVKVHATYTIESTEEARVETQVQKKMYNLIFIFLGDQMENPLSGTFLMANLGLLLREVQTET